MAVAVWISADPLLVVHVVLLLVLPIQDEILHSHGLVMVLFWRAPFSLKVLAVEEMVITSWLLERGLLHIFPVRFMVLQQLFPLLIKESFSLFLVLEIFTIDDCIKNFIHFFLGKAHKLLFLHDIL